MLNIDKLIKNAMKSKNQAELRAYKNLKAEFQLAETAKNAKPLDEARKIQILNKYIKTLEKSILDFSKAHREDLVAEYRDEQEVLRKLLPEPVNESQICSELYNYGLSVGWSRAIPMGKGIRGSYLITQIPKKEMGNVIKYLKSEFPQADGKMISDIVKEYII